jgi:hypothetical protein
MRTVWLTAALVLLLATVSAAPLGSMAMRSNGDCVPMLWPKPQVSSPPANSLAHDPRAPGVYDTWRFRYTCQPEWFVIEGWPTQARCEAGRARFMVVNPDRQVTPCAYYASGNTKPLEGYR